MSACLALLGRAAVANLGLYGDEGRTCGICLCLLDGLADGIQIIAVLNGNQLEPEGFHALLYILCKCNIRASLDGNTVGIIKYNKLAQSQGTCQ